MLGIRTISVNSAPPDISAAGKTDIFTLVTHNGGSIWYGFIGGQNF